MTYPPWVLLLLLPLWLLGVASAHEHFLILHPFYSGSHVLTLHSVAERLVGRGHRVTTVRFGDQHNFSLKPLGDNYSEILLHIDNRNGSLPYLTSEAESTFVMPMQLLWTDGLALSTLVQLPGNPWSIVKGYCDYLLGHTELRDRLRSARPTVAVVDLIFNECGLALAHELSLPSVGYWAFSFSCGEAEMTTAATPPSHVPMFLSENTHEMSFKDRLFNFLNKIFARTLMYYHTYVCDQSIHGHLPSSPSSQTLLGNLSGVLINSHNVLDYPRLLPETFVNVGGMQIPAEPSALPPQLETWLSTAPPGGVVLMTMGFIFNPAAVPSERVDALLDAFARFKDTRFIVKFETAVKGRETPENVLVLPFVPQRDILAHPNTRKENKPGAYHTNFLSTWSFPPCLEKMLLSPK